MSDSQRRRLMRVLRRYDRDPRPFLEELDPKKTGKVDFIEYAAT